MNIELEAAVARPPDVVFAYLERIDGWPEWRSAVRSAVPDGDGDADTVEAGRRWRLRLHAMGRDVEMVVEVVTVDPPFRLDVLTVEGPIRGTSRFDVTPMPDGSLVKVSASLELAGPLKIAESLLAPQLRQAWQDDLQSLAVRLESA